MGLQQHIFTPTHCDNVLDIFLTDSTGLISDVIVECPFGNTNHNTVNFSVNIEHNDITNNADILYYYYKDAAYDRLNYYISCINWDYEFSFVFTTEEYWDIFLHLATAIDLFGPQRKHTAKQLRNRKTYTRYLKNMLN